MIPVIKDIVNDLFQILVASEDTNPLQNFYIPPNGDLHVFTWENALHFLSLDGLQVLQVLIQLPILLQMHKMLIIYYNNIMIELIQMHLTNQLVMNKIMKMLISIMMLFFFSVSYSQIEKEENVYDHYNKEDTVFEKKYKYQDTLYVYFKNSNKEQKSPLRLIIPPKIKEIRYTFDFFKPKDYYGFSYQTHRNFKGNQIEIPIIEKKKKFFKRRKNEVLTYCRLKRLSFKDLESFYWKNHNKVIYLIDKGENKKGNVYLRRVNFYSGYRIIQ